MGYISKKVAAYGQFVLVYTFVYLFYSYLPPLHFKKTPKWRLNSIEKII